MSSIIDRVYNIPTLCKELNITEDAFNKMHIMDRLLLLTKTLNEGWVPDYENPEQYKYIPWFEFSDGAWYCDDCITGRTDTFVCSNFVYKTPELCKQSVACFMALYREFLDYKI